MGWPSTAPPRRLSSSSSDSSARCACLAGPAADLPACRAAALGPQARGRPAAGAGGTGGGHCGVDSQQRPLTVHVCRPADSVCCEGRPRSAPSSATRSRRWRPRSTACSTGREGGEARAAWDRWPGRQQRVSLRASRHEGGWLTEQPTYLPPMLHAAVSGWRTTSTPRCSWRCLADARPTCWTSGPCATAWTASRHCSSPTSRR